MTGIAALVHEGRVWMGGDRAGVEANHYLTLVSEPKVFIKEELLIGYSSSFSMGKALEHRLRLPKIVGPTLDRWMNVEFADAVKECFSEVGYLKTDNGRLNGGQFLVGVRGKLYYFDHDFHASRMIHDIAAIGSGVSVILGSLYSTKGLMDDPAKRIRTALEAASEFTTSVRPPFDVLCL